MAFLILQGLFHEKWKDLVEEGTGTELTSIVGKLSQSRLSHWRCSILDLEQESHNLPLLQFLYRKFVFIRSIHQLAEVSHILGLEELEISNTRKLRRQLLSEEFRVLR